MTKVFRLDKFLSSKPVLNVIKFAYNNPALFASATTLGFSAIVRPAVIIATPKTDKDDKKYAVAKSLTSSAVGFGLSYLFSKPIEKAIKKIDKSPKNYLKSNTIKHLKDNKNNLLKSEKYLFSTQFFKTAAGFISAIPKSALTCTILPFVANKIAPEKKSVSFSGKNNIAKGIGNIMNTNFMKKFTDKFSKTNLVQNTAITTDILLTASFINNIKHNNKIPEENKKYLINNSIFSTGLSILTYSSINKFSDKSTKKFIDYFLKINKNIKNKEKFIQGIKTIKTIFVMSSVYYAVIPFLSTLFSNMIKIANNKTNLLNKAQS